MKGLSDEEVRKRIDAHLVNYKVKSQTKSIGEIVRENVFTYFNLIFLILAILLGMVFAWKDMLFLAVIIANTVIGIVQEVHSKKVLDKLSQICEENGILFTKINPAYTSQKCSVCGEVCKSNRN